MHVLWNNSSRSKYSVDEANSPCPTLGCWDNGTSELSDALYRNRNGGTIIVVGGVHTGPFSVPEGVRLIGIDDPVIRNPEGIGLRILVDTYISGFTFEHCKIGIQVGDVNIGEQTE